MADDDGNFASRNRGVIVVFALVGVIAIGLFALWVSGPFSLHPHLCIIIGLEKRYMVDRWLIAFGRALPL